MTASSRRSSSTGEPSGTRRTSMPSSAGAGTVSSTSRWDPGRRPSSRVSSTSGALGSSVLSGLLPSPSLVRTVGHRNERPDQAAKHGSTLAEPLPHGLVDEVRHERRHVAPEGSDLLDQARGEEGVLRAGGDEDGLH